MLCVWVTPGASGSKVVGVHDDALKIRLAAPPEDGRANRALIDLLSSRLGVRVELLSGEVSRRKRVWVAGLRPNEVASRLLPPSRS